MKCYHHTSQDAVAKCEGPKCGKHICRDCFDKWKVDVGPWAGDPLCFDCATAMIRYNTELIMEEGVNAAEAKKRSIIGLIVGAIIGAIVGVGIGAWPGAGIGGTLGRCGFKYFFAKDENGERGFGPLIGAALLGPIFVIYYTIKERNYLTMAQEIAEQDKQSLRLMEDYFQYTLAMEKTGDNNSFESLTSQGGELFNNSYARSVKERGEQAAQTQLRESVVQIAANGEIIRNAPRAPGSRRAS